MWDFEEAEEVKSFTIKVPKNSDNKKIRIVTNWHCTQVIVINTISNIVLTVVYQRLSWVSSCMRQIVLDNKEIYIGH